jgi:hypothetical protein
LQVGIGCHDVAFCWDATDRTGCGASLYTRKRQRETRIM